MVDTEAPKDEDEEEKMADTSMVRKPNRRQFDEDEDEEDDY